MRARKKKNADKRLTLCESVLLSDPCSYKGKFSELFKNTNEIHLELGCGKGAFISEMARLHPDKNFIAFEKVKDVLVMAAEKLTADPLPNVYLVLGDAKDLPDIFEKGEVSRIYLNFSDPWPKHKQEKRRLTHKNFLSLYREILKQDGAVFFKTDNQKLFEFSLNEFCGEGFFLQNITFDLHNSKFEGNVMTEYEKRFSEEGFPIYRLEAYLKKPIKKQNEESDSIS